MNAPDHSSPPPSVPPGAHAGQPGLDALGRRPAPSRVGTPLRVLALCVGSIAVMTPWPLLGILLTRASFDEASEAFMLFGGITMFPLMVIALFGSVSEELLIALLMLVWMTAAVVPGLWLGRRSRSWRAVIGLLGVQMVFSIAQAAMGALLVLGKDV